MPPHTGLTNPEKKRIVPTMARHKQFDTNKVLNKAMTLFWENGYANTSVQDLIDKLQIGKGSIYNTFGNKHDFFLTTIDRYSKTGIARLRRAFADAPPKEAVGAILQQMVEDILKDKKNRGCFLINTTTEMAGSDPEVASRINHHHQQQLDCFKEVFQRAIRQGLLSADRNPHALALFFINTMKGLRVMAKMKPPREALQAVVDTALIVLD